MIVFYALVLLGIMHACLAITALVTIEKTSGKVLTTLFFGASAYAILVLASAILEMAR